MTIKTKYRTAGQEHARARFVRVGFYDEFEWCEQDARDLRFNIAFGTCNAEDLPEDVKQKCEEAGHNGFYACRWPFEQEQEK